MKLYASELMELVRKNPKEYEGRRYKGTPILDGMGNGCTELFVKDGMLLAGDSKYGKWAYVHSHTELEEILPEPKPVPFMEAAEAYSEGKTVDCKVGNCRYVYQKCEGDTPYKAMHEKNDESSGVSAKEILEGTWHICE